jgi:hypothetical protein
LLGIFRRQYTINLIYKIFKVICWQKLFNFSYMTYIIFV